jgi:two-component system response regulator AdeR
MTESETVVLVVDDEADVADSYAAIVGSRYEVRTAYSGEEALSKVDSDVEVVLLDRRMPDLLGADVLERIRDRGLDVSVAMVTAVDPDIDIIDMKFDDYVVKPVTRTEVLETVQRLLRVAEYERTLREYYRVTRKQAALSAGGGVDVSTDPNFEQLRDRRDRLREKLEATTDQLVNADFEALFREFEGENLSE